MIHDTHDCVRDIADLLAWCRRLTEHGASNADPRRAGRLPAGQIRAAGPPDRRHPDRLPDDDGDRR